MTGSTPQEKRPITHVIEHGGRRRATQDSALEQPSRSHRQKRRRSECRLHCDPFTYTRVPFRFRVHERLKLPVMITFSVVITWTMQWRSPHSTDRNNLIVLSNTLTSIKIRQYSRDDNNVVQTCVAADNLTHV